MLFYVSNPTSNMEKAYISEDSRWGSRWSALVPPTIDIVCRDAPVTMQRHRSTDLLVRKLFTVIFYEDNHWWEICGILSFVEKDIFYDKNSFFWDKYLSYHFSISKTGQKKWAPHVNSNFGAHFLWPS
jgi:hypothetical protein